MKEPHEEIGIYVPTRGHVWHGTASALAYVGIVNELGLPTYVQGVTGPAEVRNEIVKQFLETGKDVLVMCDDDVVPPAHVLQIAVPIIDDDFDIVAACVPIMRPGTAFMPNIFKRNGEGYDPHLDAYKESGVIAADAVGTGCIAIARKVLVDNHLKVPFRPKLHKDGTWHVGEDINFCERARARGYRVAADLGVWCEHLTELHANATAMAYMGLLKEAYDEGFEEGQVSPDGRVPSDTGANVEGA